MEKITIYIGLLVGSFVGGYVPVLLLDVGALSLVSLVSGFVGAVVGVWLGWKLTQWIGA
ncbi:MAG: hypothetical protein R2826_07570 [Thermoleophilia bacterium]